MNTNKCTYQEIDVISLFTALKRDGRAVLSDHAIKRDSDGGK